MNRRTKFLLLALSITLLLRYGYWVLPKPYSKTKIPRPPGYATSTLNSPSPPKAKEPVQRAAHVFRSDGLLEVNPNGSHPIFTLIKAAEAEWTSKLHRASRTIDQAVEEYTRRYKRLPPKGFDDWWDYVIENNVTLPDEYDSIFHSLEPFWGVHPNDLQQTMAAWEVDKAIYVATIGKEKGGPIHVIRNISGPNGEDKNLKRTLLRFVDSLKPFEDKLPDFRAVISPWDNPGILKDYELTDVAIEAAAGKTYIDLKKLPPPKPGWLSACKPSSPARQNPPSFQAANITDLAPQPKIKTFIRDHHLAMDPCLHPSHLVQVGQYLSGNEGPWPERDLIPSFSMCSTPIHLDILPVPPVGIEEPHHLHQWEEKVDERLLWRGRNTGIWFGGGMHWRSSQRVRLVRTATELSGTIKVLRPPREGEEDVGVGVGEEWSRMVVNPAIMDIHFSDQPLGEDETRELLKEMFTFVEHMSVEDSELYKYVMDVDGNGWSSRFRRLLATNSVVFKSTTYPEWFTERVQPWMHYVPISIDYSDLYDAFVFFRGDINREGNHDELARKIAAAGRSWTEKFWRDEDISAYLFRLFLEYARVMSLDRDAMTYKGTF
ncbi:hypothetical protein BD410DRAFT_772680 [Rickenella mellea]|uniref:Glycosyl transferase CAP10 domain-containing protein n=1 Tax=Rickenella mellea TaxID=50990 RepID=A0A4Y7PYD7_9AGAM|nr:hypothetical protein BD410DRAFT_772680 [Rickenella mellea]